jgi:hypothetical protein
MAANRLAMPAAWRTLDPLESPPSSTRQAASAADWNWKAQFEAYVQPVAGSGGGFWGEAPDPGDRGGGRPVGREELTPGGTPRLPVQSLRGRDGHPPPPGPPDGS